MIQNFRPGGLARYGLDFATVSAANPGIVYASISGFGTGPGARVPGYDLMVQAVSGLMSLTGDPDGPPYRAGISVFDVMAGNHAVIGILAALRHRDATGAGPARGGQPARPRRCPGWSTTARPTSRAAWCPTGWATRTPASSRTSRCRPRTAS